MEKYEKIEFEVIELNGDDIIVMSDPLTGFIDAEEEEEEEGSG